MATAPVDPPSPSQSHSSGDEEDDEESSMEDNEPVKLNREQQAVFKQAFEMFDKNKSSNLDEAELRNVIKALGFTQTKQEIKAIFDEWDDDKSGLIEYNEFMNMVQTKLMKNRQLSNDLKETFKHFCEVDEEARDDDDDDYNFIDVDKLMIVANNLNEPLDKQTAVRMIEIADRNKDGKVDLEDFMMVMRRMKLYPGK